MRIRAILDILVKKQDARIAVVERSLEEPYSTINKNPLKERRSYMFIYRPSQLLEELRERSILFLNLEFYLSRAVYRVLHTLYKPFDKFLEPNYPESSKNQKYIYWSYKIDRFFGFMGKFFLVPLAFYYVYAYQVDIFKDKDLQFIVVSVSGFFFFAYLILSTNYYLLNKIEYSVQNWHFYSEDRLKDTYLVSYRTARFYKKAKKFFGHKRFNLSEGKTSSTSHKTEYVDWILWRILRDAGQTPNDFISGHVEGYIESKYGEEALEYLENNFDRLERKEIA